MQQRCILIYTLLVIIMLTVSLQYIPVATATSHISNRSFTIDRVDIQAQLLADGDMEVEELYTYTFDGTYHETIRTIGKEGYEGVEFFQAYSVDDAYDMNEWDHTQLHQLLALKVHKTTSDDLFKYAATLSAKNETKKVLYHYRLRGVMKSSNSIGYWNWKFFDYRNPSTIGDVHIRMELPEALADSEELQVHADTYFPDTGSLNVQNHRVISYDYPMLFAGEPLDMRISFPLAEPQVENHNMSKLDNAAPYFSLDHDAWTYVGKWNSLTKWSAIIIALFLAVIVPVFLWNFVIVPVYYRILIRRYMRMDMLELKAIYSRGEWDSWSILAGALSLYRRRIIDADFKKPTIFDRTPVLTFTRRHHMSERLRTDDKYLMDWLFTQGGGNMFAVNSIFMIAISESASKYQQNQSRQRLNKIHSALPQWGALVSKELKLPDPSVYELIKLVKVLVGYGVATILFAKCLNIDDLDIVYFRSPIKYWLTRDIDPTGDFFSRWFDPFFYLGIGSFIGLWIVIGLAFLMYGVYAVIIALTNRSVDGEPRFLERVLFWFIDKDGTHILKKGIAISFLLNVLWLCAFNPPNAQLWMISCAIFLCVAVCFYPLPMHRQEIPIQQLRYRLMNGKYSHVMDAALLEWLFQASLVLQCADEFLGSHPQIKAIAEQHPEHELLSKAHRIVYAVNTVWGSIIEFENREREIKERKERSRLQREQARARNDYYSSSSSSDSTSYSADSSSSSLSDSSDSGGGGGSSSD